MHLAREDVQQPAKSPTSFSYRGGFAKGSAARTCTSVWAFFFSPDDPRFQASIWLDANRRSSTLRRSPVELGRAPRETVRPGGAD